MDDCCAGFHHDGKIRKYDAKVLICFPADGVSDSYIHVKDLDGKQHEFKLAAGQVLPCTTQLGKCFALSHVQDGKGGIYWE